MKHNLWGKRYGALLTYGPDSKPGSHGLLAYLPRLGFFVWWAHRWIFIMRTYLLRIMKEFVSLKRLLVFFLSLSLQLLFISRSKWNEIIRYERFMVLIIELLCNVYLFCNHVQLRRLGFCRDSEILINELTWFVTQFSF